MGQWGYVTVRSRRVARSGVTGRLAAHTQVAPSFAAYNTRVRLSRTAPRSAVLLVAAALAISAGWAFFLPFRAAASGSPVHTIGSHFAHVPQALSPRFPTDERKDLRHAPQPATLSAADSSTGWVPVCPSDPATAAGSSAVLAASPQPRAP